MRRDDCGSWVSDIESDAMASSAGPPTHSSLDDDYSDATTRIRSPYPTRHHPKLAVTHELPDEAATAEMPPHVDSEHKILTVQSSGRKAVSQPRHLYPRTRRVPFICAIFLLLLIAGGVTGGVLGSRKNKGADSRAASPPLPSSNSSSSTASASLSTPTPPAPAFNPNKWYTISQMHTTLSPIYSRDTFFFYARPNGSSPSSSSLPFIDLGANTDYNPYNPIANKQFQIHPAPPLSPAATPHPSATHPLYWISPQVYGPHVNLMLYHRDWDDASPDGPDRVAVTFGAQNTSDAAQYWFFAVDAWAASLNGEAAEFRVSLCNALSGAGWPVVYGGREWSTPFLSRSYREAAVWNVTVRGEIEWTEGGERWVVDSNV